MKNVLILDFSVQISWFWWTLSAKHGYGTSTARQSLGIVQDVSPERGSDLWHSLGKTQVPGWPPPPPPLPPPPGLWFTGLLSFAHWVDLLGLSWAKLAECRKEGAGGLWMQSVSSISYVTKAKISVSKTSCHKVAWFKQVVTLKGTRPHLVSSHMLAPP